MPDEHCACEPGHGQKGSGIIHAAMLYFTYISIGGGPCGEPAENGR